MAGEKEPFRTLRTAGCPAGWEAVRYSSGVVASSRMAVEKAVERVRTGPPAWIPRWGAGSAMGAACRSVGAVWRRPPERARSGFL